MLKCGPDAGSNQFVGVHPFYVNIISYQNKLQITVVTVPARWEGQSAFAFLAQLNFWSTLSSVSMLKEDRSLIP